jgi:hypothetical protein
METTVTARALDHPAGVLRFGDEVELTMGTEEFHGGDTLLGTPTMTRSAAASITRTGISSNPILSAYQKFGLGFERLSRPH